MKHEFLLTVHGYQHYENQTPDLVELTTEAELTAEGGVLYLRYNETELTGLVGTVTTFEIHPHRVVLRRSGTLVSEMEFMCNDLELDAGAPVNKLPWKMSKEELAMVAAWRKTVETIRLGKMDGLGVCISQSVS